MRKLMPWQGDANNMIDRFDVRAHLDYIPEYTPPLFSTVSLEQESDERKCNYERYRGLVQNDFAGISEDQCLYQIYIDELYGGLQKPTEEEKKKLAEKKASIGYTYEDSTVAETEKSSDKEEEDSEEDSNSDEDEVIPDIDVEVDVDELNEEQVADLNKQATTYGMASEDFVRMLRKDKEEAEAIKHAKALEEEKAMYSGRRSRRQRREFREKRLKGRKISPPSYARRDSPTYDPYKRSQSESSSETRSRSRTPSPGREEKITFITSFGGSDEETVAPLAEGAPGKSLASSKLMAQAQPGTAAAGRSTSSRKHSTSSSSSSSFSSSSSSRSSSQSRRGSGHHRASRYSRSHSRTRRYSRSRSRNRRHSDGGSRDGHRRSRSYSTDRNRLYSHRRSRSHSGDRYHHSGRTTGRRHSSSSESVSCSRSRSASPARERAGKPVASPAVGEKLRKPDSAACKETRAAKPKLTPQEKLKLRMQKALNKQFKADKRAAQEKMIQQEHERQEREDELRAMARKIRMKERERREKEREEWERQYSRQSRSPSPRYSREYNSSRRRSRSRSRSPHYRH
ncbi:CLK4-associating serine/arginine rich protein isoform X2 [Rhinatrema bivittatum]|uniref:CLK4-associating serine/arginine rich protein isoform X2 n=1 Tax=Rhinatrema bivittatum TaxID=194408 RepID=UPI0011272F0C|nr:CLK4-associating serine/arginine rich protein isoform X2 [Rhinatrema bivittatum]